MQSPERVPNPVMTVTSPRFAVETVVEPAFPALDSCTNDAENTLSPGLDTHMRTTVNYTTADAVPMTVFYRNHT